MDGTLLDLHFDNYFWQELVPRTWASQRQLSAEEGQRLLRPRFQAEYGTLNWYCLDHWSRDLGLDIVGLKHEIRHLIRPRADALAFLQRLRDDNKQVWLVTNAHPDALALKLAATDISPYFQRIISSHQFGHAKEAAAFWHALQQEAPFQPTTTLFIDDSEAVLHSARNFGIAHLLTIAQPDSQLPTRRNLHYPALGDFAELFTQHNRPLHKTD